MKKLDVPFVALSHGDLAALASHVAELAAERRRELEAEQRALYRSLRLTGRALETKVQESIANLGYGRPRYTLTLPEGGSTSGPSWEEIWLAANYPDVIVISMAGESSTTDVSLRLSLTGYGRHGSSVEISSKDAAQFEREMGYFTQFFHGKRADVRRRLSPETWLGRILWFIVPPLIITLLFMRWATAQNPGSPNSERLIAGFGIFVFVAWVLFFIADVYAGRVLPRVVVEGVGPYQMVRQAAVILLLSLVTSGIFAVVSTIWL